MQHVLQRHLGALEAPALQDLEELADALLVRARGALHVEVVAHHHHVAAVERAGAHDVLHAAIVEELAHGGLDLVLLAVAAGRAGVGDDGAAARDDGRVLHEAGVGELLERRQHRHLHAAVLEGRDVVVVLLACQLVVRLAQLGCRRDALHHALGGAADDNIGELGHVCSFSCAVRVRVSMRIL